MADLGTGSGHIARFLKEHGVDVLGVDLSPRTVALDWRFFPMATVAGALEGAGLAVEAKVERAPYASEYPTPRGYVMARKRGS